jgi:hypothetical protein
MQRRLLVDDQLATVWKTHFQKAPGALCIDVDDVVLQPSVGQTFELIQQGIGSLVEFAVSHTAGHAKRDECRQCRSAPQCP